MDGTKNHCRTLGHESCGPYICHCDCERCPDSDGYVLFDLRGEIKDTVRERDEARAITAARVEDLLAARRERDEARALYQAEAATLGALDTKAECGHAQRYALETPTGAGDFDVRCLLCADAKNAEALTAAVQQRDEARASLLEVARAAGIFYAADGHNDEPGPTAEIVASIRAIRDVEAERAEALFERDEARAERDALAFKSDELEEQLRDVRRTVAICKEGIANGPKLFDAERARDAALARAEKAEAKALAYEGGPGADMVTRAGADPAVRRATLNDAVRALSAAEDVAEKEKSARLASDKALTEAREECSDHAQRLTDMRADRDRWRERCGASDKARGEALTVLDECWNQFSVSECGDGTAGSSTLEHLRAFLEQAGRLKPYVKPPPSPAARAEDARAPTKDPARCPKCAHLNADHWSGHHGGGCNKPGCECDNLLEPHPPPPILENVEGYPLDNPTFRRAADKVLAERAADGKAADEFLRGLEESLRRPHPPPGAKEGD